MWAGPTLKKRKIKHYMLCQSYPQALKLIKIILDIVGYLCRIDFMLFTEIMKIVDVSACTKNYTQSICQMTEVSRGYHNYPLEPFNLTKGIICH